MYPHGNYTGENVDCRIIYTINIEKQPNGKSKTVMQAWDGPHSKLNFKGGKTVPILKVQR